MSPSDHHDTDLTKEDNMTTIDKSIPAWTLVHAAQSFDDDTFASFADAIGARVTFDGGAS